ncbi:MAG: tripartite tricarboxylate transporter substrate binding protein [Paralcaligenes sp.]
MKILRNTLITILSMVAVSVAGVGPITAQAAYPDAKPINLVIPFPAGGGVDVVGRIIAQYLATKANANVIVENKGGAGGTIGVGFVARAAPDGYTATMGSPGNISIAPSIYSRLPYSPSKNLQPVSMVVKMPLLLVSRVDAPFTSVKELIAYGKQHVGKLTYGSGGTGTSQHLAGAMFAQMAHIDAVHVPYKGSAPMLIDLMAGRIDYAFIDTSAISNIKAGKLKLLAVTSAKRSELLPDTLTVAESGVPNFEAVNWYGLFMPIGVSSAVSRWLNEHVSQALKDPAVVGKLRAQSMEPAPAMTVEEFTRFIKQDTKKWAELVHSMNLTLN